MYELLVFTDGQSIGVVSWYLWSRFTGTYCDMAVMLANGCWGSVDGTHGLDPYQFLLKDVGFSYCLVRVDTPVLGSQLLSINTAKRGCAMFCACFTGY